MSEYEPYSMRRKAAERSGRPAVVVFDPIPQRMRIQAFYVIEDALGTRKSQQRVQTNRRNGWTDPYPNWAWKTLEELIRKERGRIKLVDSPAHYPEAIIRDYFAKELVTDSFLDALEISLRYLQELTVEHSYHLDSSKVGNAIALMNKRFRQHDLGYEFVAGTGEPGFLLRVDSQYIHREAVEPAIASLYAAGFHGALDEFVEAHKKYRHDDNKGAMTEALKAFESTMKAICSNRQWTYDPKWTAKPLIDAMISNGLFPKEMESYLGGVRSMFESGVPTLRNRMAGHGQGAEITDVPDHIAAFTLHLTAANIVLLMAAHNAKP